MPFTLAVDSSQIHLFLTCPQQWAYRYINNIVLKRPKESGTSALDKGTIMHGLLERYYHALAMGESKHAAMLFSIADLNKDRANLNCDDETFRFLLKRFTEYVSHYKDEATKVLQYNGKPGIEIGFSHKIIDDGYFLFVLEGRIDLIAENNGIQMIMDHKTQASARDLYMKSVQFRNYAMVTGYKHVQVNYIGLQDKVNPKTFRRNVTAFSTEYLRQWRLRLIRIFHQMAFALSHLQFEQNFASCEGKYQGKFCQYTQLCECTAEENRARLIEIGYETPKAWTPWELEE